LSCTDDTRSELHADYVSLRFGRNPRRPQHDAEFLQDRIVSPSKVEVFDFPGCEDQSTSKDGAGLLEFGQVKWRDRRRQFSGTASGNDTHDRIYATSRMDWKLPIGGLLSVSSFIGVVNLVRSFWPNRTKLKFLMEAVETSFDPDDWNEHIWSVVVTVTNKGKKPISLRSSACEFKFKTMAGIKSRTGYTESLARLEFEGCYSTSINLPIEPWTSSSEHGMGMSEIVSLDAVYVVDSVGKRWSASTREMKSFRRSAIGILPLKS
jgi:hypothetical protein